LSLSPLDLLLLARRDLVVLHRHRTDLYGHRGDRDRRPRRAVTGRMKPLALVVAVVATAVHEHVEAGGGGRVHLRARDEDHGGWREEDGRRDDDGHRL